LLLAVSRAMASDLMGCADEHGWVMSMSKCKQMATRAAR
jgi:hypothetical protein